MTGSRGLVGGRPSGSGQARGRRLLVEVTGSDDGRFEPVEVGGLPIEVSKFVLRCKGRSRR